MLSILVMYAINASTFYARKLLLQDISPFWLTALSTLVSGLLLLAYEYKNNRQQVPVTKNLFRKLLPASLCIMYGAALLRMYSLNFISPATLTFFGALDPFIAALLGYFLKKEKLTGFQAGGMLLATAGSLPLLAATTTTGLALANFRQFLSFPALAGLASVVVNRYGWLLLYDHMTNKPSSSEKTAPSTELITSLMMLIGGSLSFGTAFAFEKLAFSSFTFAVLGIFAYFIVTNSICSSMYASHVSKYGVTLLALTEFFNPVFAALIGWCFFKEPITITFVISSFVVLLGLGIFSHTELARFVQLKKQKSA